MAPALTQAAEPHNLAEAPCHTPDDSRSNSTLYDSLKCLNKCIHSNQGLFDSEHILFSNSDCVPSGLAPPAFGWAEGRPVPNTSPCNSNMDEQPPLPLSISDTCFSSDNLLSASNPVAASETMGLQSCIANIDAASNLIPKGSEAASTAAIPNSSLDDTSALLSNQNELLQLWNFKSVNDIIDTLQCFASNPELLDAAARDLDSGGAVQNAPQCQTPEDRAASVLDRLAARQSQLERRRLFLLRRFQRVTAKGLGVSVSSQLSHLTKHVHCLLEEERSKHPKREKMDEHISLDMLHKESMKSMSTSDLISLVRRVEASNNLQRFKETKIKSEMKEVSLLPTSLCTQMEAVASEMRSAALRHSAHDSDATESSSGGESCDEMEGFSSINTNYKPIRERAFYRYCRMRGWVASKWMWLQAQIADLDNKIAKQQKLHSDIKRNKGAVQLAEETLPLKAKPPVRDPAHLDMQDPALTCIGTPATRTTLNGYHPARMEDMGSLPAHPASLDISKGCARTLGIQRVKRRRFVRPNMSVLNTSACNLNSNSTRKVCPVFCKCVPPLTCILCDKSRNNSCKNNVISFGNHVLNSKKLGAVALFNQSVEESLSKVDEAFHPVLSRYTEMLQGELLHAAFKSPEWQTRALAKKIVPQKEDQSSNLSGSLLEPLAKRRRDKNGRRRLTKDEVKDKIASVQSRRNLNGEEDGEDVEDELGSWQAMSGSNCSSPCPSPAFADKGSEKEGKTVRKQSVGPRQKQNSTSNSYDINNIVIPYSMASTSRVEMLQYKEIPTPKWRVEEIPPLFRWFKKAPNADEDDEEEDVSEEATNIRHGRSEELERKKFLQYLHTQVNSSSRSSRSRRADSSGTNTPDHPMSPRPLEPMDTTSPMATPPGTPLLAPSEDSNHSTTQTPSTTTQQPTVLTLSLSSLKSSLLKTNPPDEAATSISHSIRHQKPPSTVSSHTPVDGGPALRTRRVLSAGGGGQMRSGSLCEEQSEKDRVSPFPCRHFPLTENDFEDLVHEDHLSCPSPRNVPPLSARLKGHQTVSVPDATAKVEEGLVNNNATPAGTDVESGRESPLSELTDSAPEEEGAWDDGAAVDWTISAVHDRCGGFIMTVQKN